MLEFYTDEFRKRASKQINEVNEIIEDKMPVLQKWQMKRCYVESNDFNATYVPICDENSSQIGTEIKVNFKDEEYTLTAGEEVLKLRHVTSGPVIETYLIQIENGALITDVSFINNDDFVMVKMKETNGIELLDVLTNLDARLYKNALLNRESFNILECIKDLYYSNKSIKKIRK